jgi:SnoaL-like domain
MSQENTEVVRRLLAGYGRDGPMEVPALVEGVWASHGDYYPVEKFPESRPCHGVEEIARFLSEFQQAWERHEFEVKALTPVRDDRVMVRASLVAEGRGSGLSLQGELFLCFSLRHGRIFREEDHLTLPGALRALGLSGKTLEAAGLSESAMSQGNLEASRVYFDEIARSSQAGLDPEATGSKLAKFWDPEIEFDMSESPVLDLGGVYRGIESCRRLWEEWFAAWETLEFEYELVEAGDRVVALIDLLMRGRSTGIEVPLGKHAFVTTFKDGLMVHSKLHMSQSQALEAAGLRE